jgi:hypothetical protein
MALDATAGGATSNSYVTVLEADAYFDNRAHSDDWKDLITEKEGLLISASQQLDWYLNWNGVRFTAEQSMGWPRTGVTDDRGEIVPDTIIPQVVKIAVFELALSNIESDRTADGDLEGIKEARAGSLLIKTDVGVYNSPPSTIPEKVKLILKGYISNNSIGVVRLIRA